MATEVLTFRMDSVEVDALDKIIKALQKLDYRIDGKKLSRNVFIINAVKTSISQVLPVIEEELKKIEEAHT